MKKLTVSSFRKMKEAGEKIFSVEEELYLPDSAPKMDQIISWKLYPKVTDQRVLTDKAVLRGTGNLHVLYRSDAGQIHSWDFEVPFSQYTDLRGEYGSEARMDVAVMPTSLGTVYGRAMPHLSFSSVAV